MQLIQKIIESTNWEPVLHCYFIYSLTVDAHTKIAILFWYEQHRHYIWDRARSNVPFSNSSSTSLYNSSCSLGLMR